MFKLIRDREFAWSHGRRQGIHSTNLASSHGGVESQSQIVVAPRFDGTVTSEAGIIKVYWVACCGMGEKCCVKPIIFVNREYGLRHKLARWTENPPVTPFYALWVEIDGKVFDNYQDKNRNQELPRLGMKDTAIGYYEQRSATQLTFRDQLHAAAPYITSIGSDIFLDPVYDSVIYSGDIHRCGSANLPLCFPRDGKAHKIKLGIQEIRPEGGVTYGPRYYDVSEVVCEPCSYEVITHVEYVGPMGIESIRHLPVCRVDITLINNGGVNGRGCIGGYQWLQSSGHGGRWWDGDNTETLRYDRLPAPPLTSGTLLKSVTISGYWTDVVRLYDVCGNVIAEVPVSANCQEVDRLVRLNGESQIGVRI